MALNNFICVKNMHIGNSIQYALWKNDKRINWFADQIMSRSSSRETISRATASSWCNSKKSRGALANLDIIADVFGVSEDELILYAKKYDPDTMAANKRWFGRYRD